MKFRYKGVEFGGNTGPLIVTKFNPGAAEVRSGDNPRSGRDGLITGRDFLGGSNWAFDIATNMKNLTDALAVSAVLETAWKDPALRLSPNTTSPLSYEMAGRWRRVYGRPGNYLGPIGTVRAIQGRGEIICDFRVTDPLFYDEDETTIRLTIVPASTGGLKAPLRAPLNTSRSGAPRAGLVTVGGTSKTPIKVTFNGPVKDPWVRTVDGLEVGLLGSLAYDQSVTVDPASGTALRNDGRPFTSFTRKTVLSRSVVSPGSTEFTFGGTDLTGTATVDLSWRNAYDSI